MNGPTAISNVRYHNGVDRRYNFSPQMPRVMSVCNLPKRGQPYLLTYILFDKHVSANSLNIIDKTLKKTVVRIPPTTRDKQIIKEKL